MMICTNNHTKLRESTVAAAAVDYICGVVKVD